MPELDLKPCPFCGSRRIVKGERYFAMCVDCGATGPERNADASVRKFMGDWNTRSDVVPTSSLDGLRYALDIVKGRRILNRAPAYLAALDEIEIFLKAAIERVEHGDPMYSTATVQ